VGNPHSEMRHPYPDPRPLDPQDAPIGHSHDADPKQNVKITFFVNAGFLLQFGDSAVLVDAFVGDSNSVCGALPDDIHEALICGRPPFDSIHRRRRS
jgi:hypothetical protein